MYFWWLTWWWFGIATSKPLVWLGKEELYFLHVNSTVTVCSLDVKRCVSYIIWYDNMYFHVMYICMSYNCNTFECWITKYYACRGVVFSSLQKDKTSYYEAWQYHWRSIKKVKICVTNTLSHTHVLFRVFCTCIHILYGSCNYIDWVKVILLEVIRVLNDVYD